MNLQLNMKTWKSIIAIATISSSLSPMLSTNAAPTANQIKNWLSVGGETVKVGGVVYQYYSEYLDKGRRMAQLRNNETGKILLTYAANCRDRNNADRFVQDSANDEIMFHIYKFNNREQRRRIILGLIARACTY
ncbi:hypothetical protein LC593_10305 [Nostoc sp. CHAB 5844]|nr:hypothetical protein [Nostoc sp. CHAB 5844]